MTTTQMWRWGAVAVVVILVAALVQSREVSLEKAVSYGGMMQNAALSRTMMSESTSDELSIVPEDPTAGPIGDAQEARLIQTAAFTVQTDDVRADLENIGKIARAHKGFVQSSHSGERPDGSRFGSITVRVPIAQYDEALSALRGAFTRIVEETLNTQDVTEQYTDLQARLRVARDEEQAYIALLNRSGSVSDLLQVQRELSNVRSRIERLEGQLQYLENQTDYTTISVVLEESALVAIPSKPFQPREAVKGAVQSVVVIAQNSVTALIWLVILGVGVGIPLGLLFLFGRFAYRKWRR